MRQLKDIRVDATHLHIIWISIQESLYKSILEIFTNIFTPKNNCGGFSVINARDECEDGARILSTNLPFQIKALHPETVGGENRYLKVYH